MARDKDKKKRRHSSDESSSDSHSDGSSSENDRDRKRRKKHKSDRKKTKKDKRGDESKVKTSSSKYTAEEKRIRKLEKELKRGGTKDVFGYTNDNNPFGDSNLTEKFVWKKRIDHIKETGDLDKLKKGAQKNKQEELLKEIEKVKKRRLDRGIEKAKQEEERARLAREKEQESFADWERKEEQFHLHQAKLRSEIRIKEGREKPIDILSKNLRLFESGEGGDIPPDIDIELKEPYMIFNGLFAHELAELKQDIQMHLEWESERNKEFWDALLIVADDEIEKAKSREASQKAQHMSVRRHYESGIHAAIKDEVHSIFSGKTSKELSQLERQVREKINSNEPGVDVEYWDGLLKQLVVFRAKARLKEIHADLLITRLNQLEKQREVEFREGRARRDQQLIRANEFVSAAPKISADDQLQAGGLSPPLEPFDEDEKDTYRERPLSPELEPLSDTEMEVSCPYSPVLLPDTDVELSKMAIDPEKDFEDQRRQKIQIFQKEIRRRNLIPKPPVPIFSAQPAPPPVPASSSSSSSSSSASAYGTSMSAVSKGRQQVAAGGLMPSGTDTEEQFFKKMAASAMEDDEEAFGNDDVVALEPTAYKWQDKYRPRKPRFFNRVKTGYEWNKYNQTHYDQENPPPKTVQGYKFNIFYPDLIDKSKAPTFTIEKDPNPEFCILRFHAGPPYEDIAFKIVNREWEHSHKRGYRCVFERGILQLYFNFQRYRYRR